MAFDQLFPCSWSFESVFIDGTVWKSAMLVVRYMYLQYSSYM